MNLITHILLFVTFLYVACDNQFIEIDSNVTAIYNVTATFTTQQPEHNKIKHKTTSSRIPGKISNEKCTKYQEIYEPGYYEEYIDTGESLYQSLSSDYIRDNNDEAENSTISDEYVTEVTGGTIVIYQEFPHMALLGYHTNINNEIQWNCGGSLISENFVLTAAHCVKGQTSPPTYVRVGITIQTNHTHLQERKVSETIAHPEYTPKDKYHDIALLRLERDFELKERVYPVSISVVSCLHTEKHISQRKAIATGWGFTEFLGPGSNHLMKVDLDFFTKEDCTKQYKDQINSSRGFLRRGIDDELIICAGSTDEIKNTCQGDSGGPLQVYRQEEGIYSIYEIVGVTSFGRACSLRKGVPGIYTRVSNYVKWIEDIVWPE